MPLTKDRVKRGKAEQIQKWGFLGMVINDSERSKTKILAITQLAKGFGWIFY
ncbi:MAG TPA: hypothetical protein VIX91_25320 [Candidatus Acidoferrum sp.]